MFSFQTQNTLFSQKRSFFFVMGIEMPPKILGKDGVLWSNQLFTDALQQKLEKNERDRLEHKTSCIIGAGEGLFTKTPFAQGEIICEYTGVLKDKLTIDEEYGPGNSTFAPFAYDIVYDDNKYFDLFKKEYFIDAVEPCMARFANDCYEGAILFTKTIHNSLDAKMQEEYQMMVPPYFKKTYQGYKLTRKQEKLTREKEKEKKKKREKVKEKRIKSHSNLESKMTFRFVNGVLKEDLKKGQEHLDPQQGM